MTSPPTLVVSTPGLTALIWTKVGIHANCPLSFRPEGASRRVHVGNREVRCSFLFLSCGKISLLLLLLVNCCLHLRRRADRHQRGGPRGRRFRSGRLKRFLVRVIIPHRLLGIKTHRRPRAPWRNASESSRRRYHAASSHHSQRWGPPKPRWRRPSEPGSPTHHRHGTHVSRWRGTWDLGELEKALCS